LSTTVFEQACDPKQFTKTT